MKDRTNRPGHGRPAVRKGLLLAATVLLSCLIPAVSVWAAGTVSLTGTVTSYNPNVGAVIKLVQDANVIRTGSVTPRTGSGETTEPFTLDGITPGVYDVVIEKQGSLSYTVTGVSLYGDVDLGSYAGKPWSSPKLVCGDINSDDHIDSIDISCFSFDMGKTDNEATYHASDLDGDHYRDALDISVLSFDLLAVSSVDEFDEARYERSILSFDQSGELGGSWWGLAAVSCSPTGGSDGGFYVMNDDYDSSVICGNLTAVGGLIDLSPMDHGAALMLDVYVADASRLDGDTPLNVTLSVSRDAPYEDTCAVWTAGGLKNGWNTVVLYQSECETQVSFDWAAVRFLHVTLNKSGSMTWGIDNLRLSHRAPISRVDVVGDTTAVLLTDRASVLLPALSASLGSTMAYYDGDDRYVAGESYAVTAAQTTLTARQEIAGTKKMILTCDTNTGWWGTTAISHVSDNVKEGSGANATTDAALPIFCAQFDGTVDLSSFRETGYIHFWLYVSDASLLKTSSASNGQLELNDTKSNTYAFNVATYGLVTGWNEVMIPFSSAVRKTGDLTDLSSFRLFQYVDGSVTLILDDMYAWMPDTTHSIRYTSASYDRLLGITGLTRSELKENKSVKLYQNPFARDGYTFVGWNDGTATYAAGSSYTMPRHDVVMTAEWAPATAYTYTFADGMGNSDTPVTSYEGARVILPACPYRRSGYTFDGWDDGSEVYRPGMTYTMPAANVTFTARWQVLTDAALLTDALGAWELHDGGSALTAASAIGGAAGTAQYAVWLNSDTFGRALDFSCERSCLTIPSAGLSLKSTFTVSAFVMIPVRENTARVIAAEGNGSTSGWKLYVAADGTLSFAASGLYGTGSSGKNIADGVWHHVMVSSTGSKLTYYVDGTAVKTSNVYGTIRAADGTFRIGNDAGGSSHLDGTVAQVRVWGSAKTPAQATSTVIAASDNTAKAAVLDVKNGVVLERNASAGLSVSGYEVYDPNRSYRALDANDIRQIRRMGFDHVKLTITPNNMIDANGHLIVENLSGMTTDVNYVLNGGLPVMICLHPEPNYKETYLADLGKFELMCNWYREFAAYVRDHWSADQVLFQLMTEPYANNGSVSWTYMSDRMWGAVRNEMPDHTIVTSSDSSGNLERLKLMSPATDSNLIYSFTTYEPYTIGFCGLNGGFSTYVKNVPYPVPDGLTNAQIEAMVDDITADVPEGQRETAKTYIRAYLRGEWDNNPYYTNHYSTGYNAQWNMNRMNSLSAWRNKYGGNIHIMCVEFGCMDMNTARQYYGMQPGHGITDTERYNLIRDLRTAFEANDIGWSYWLYNGVFTVYKPSTKQMGVPVTDWLYRSFYDATLIEDCLGLDPLY